MNKTQKHDGKVEERRVIERRLARRASFYPCAYETASCIYRYVYMTCLGYKLG